MQNRIVIDHRDPTMYSHIHIYYEVYSHIKFYKRTKTSCIIITVYGGKRRMAHI